MIDPRVASCLSRIEKFATIVKTMATRTNDVARRFPAVVRITEKTEVTSSFVEEELGEGVREVYLASKALGESHRDIFFQKLCEINSLENLHIHGVAVLNLFHLQRRYLETKQQLKRLTLHWEREEDAFTMIRGMRALVRSNGAECVRLEMARGIARHTSPSAAEALNVLVTNPKFKEVEIIRFPSAVIEIFLARLSTKKLPLTYLWVRNDLNEKLFGKVLKLEQLTNFYITPGVRQGNKHEYLQKVCKLRKLVYGFKNQ